MENNNPNSKPQDGQQMPAYIPDTKIEQRSHLDKLAAVFLPEDLNTVSNSIIDRIIIPSILKTAGEILHKSIDMIFGTNFTGVNQSPQSKPETVWTPYRNIDMPQQTGTLQILPVRSGVYDYKVIKFRSKERAIETLNSLRVMLQNNGFVSVASYLQLTGQKTIPEDFNYGWTSLSTVKLQSTGDMDYPYRMILPAPIAIRKSNDEIYI